MEYFLASMPSDASYPSVRLDKSATFRLLSPSDVKSLQSYGVRAYFPPRSEPIYAPQRRSLPFPASGSPSPSETSSSMEENLLNMLIAPRSTLKLDKCEAGWEEYQISPPTSSASPYSPGGGSSFSDPDVPQDPLTPSEEFDPDYFETLIGIGMADSQDQCDEPIDAIFQQLVTGSPVAAHTPPPSGQEGSILTQCLTSELKSIPKSASPAQPKAKRGRRPVKDINIQPPQLGASGSASLWEFILELLADSTYEAYIRWTDHSKGQFKIYDSQVVAALWGKHKNHAGMNFDKMSRAMRYYYGKNILEKGDQGGRLEYQFQEGSQWLSYISRNLNRRNFSAPDPNQYSSGLGQPVRVSRRRSSQRNRGANPY